MQPSGAWLRVSHVNINPVRYKRDTVQQFIYNYKPHVLGITETWLDPTVSSTSLAIEDYVIVRCDRGLRSNRSLINGAPRYVQGGGVAFYLHISLEYKVLHMSSIRHIAETEYLILEILV